MNADFDLSELIGGGVALAAPVHSNRDHAILSASGCERWWECPGSVAMQHGLPDVTSEYALEGTTGHELSEALLRSGEDAWTLLGQAVGPEGQWTADEDGWVKPIQKYLDTCRVYMDQSGGWTHWIEHKISLAPLKPPTPMFGTADFVAFHAETHRLVIIDLKFGRGVQVRAHDNPQLKYYALGTVLSLKHLQIDSITMMIVQPRVPWGDPVRSAEISGEELATWSIELMARAHATTPPDASLKAGSWCRFCKRRGDCRTQAEAALSGAMESARNSFTGYMRDAPDTPFEAVSLVSPNLLSDEQISFLLRDEPVFTQFIKNVKEVAVERITHGRPIARQKLVETQPRRHFIEQNDDTMAATLTRLMELPAAEIWKRVLVTPAQAEAKFKKAMMEEGFSAKQVQEMLAFVFDPLVVYKSSGTKLVPDGDVRSPVSVRGSGFDLLPYQGP